MGIFNYIFIFLFHSFGSIESKNSINSTFTSDRIAFSQSSFVLSLGNQGKQPNALPNIPFCSVNMKSTAGYVVINEIMADPTPVSGLPDREYLELYNYGNSTVNLKNWILELGTKQKVFPDCEIMTGGYLLVTSTGGIGDLQKYGKVLEISGFGITNSGQNLSLIDPAGNRVDGLGYMPTMHKKGLEGGGFSLERIDPERKCGASNNWVSTLSSKGGTPGSENTVHASNPDLIPPKVLSTLLAEQRRLEIQMSESFVLPPIASDLLKNVPAGLIVDSLKIAPALSKITIHFRASSILNGSGYTFILQGLQDECGNVMEETNIKFGYYQPVKSDLLITEVLFNPFPDGEDFVEIFNNSGHDVDLSGLFLATRDGSGALKQIYPLMNEQQYLSADSYLAITRSKEGILRFYHTTCQECLLQILKFPSLTDESGTIVLLNSNLEVLDEMSYSDKMHNPLVTETEGISLERISISASSSQLQNWHSASKSVGFATPGYKNSVNEMRDTTSQMVQITPDVFSPNGDNFNDQLNICINTGETGWLLNITILNCTGHIVRNLANNFSTGSSDGLNWNGLGDDFQMVQPGIYILNLSLFHPSGKTCLVRRACVITDHL
jgi:hypothetical protein